jgi:hypothetical protein
MTYTATYSPEDNKLRLYSSTRLDRELYDRVRGAGFIYAPKQELFVAPMWTPEREDLLIELCGEIGDEDTSLSTTPLRHWHGSSTKVEIERVKDYRAPDPATLRRSKPQPNSPRFATTPAKDSPR